VNWYLDALYQTASRGLDESQNGLIKKEHGAFWENLVASWARLNTIYSEIETTQRDVLTGVMFFIALFVPFAYCMERYLFCFRNIYKQLVAFLLILVMTIFTIRGLHPAFQLTYSPMVVIIAFFIVGLSLLVSWIIFIRFEEEMAQEQGRARPGTPQASKWKAFGAGFAIGVSNLNRRKLRTGLTCITLIILTFTVMSYTNVKSLHKTTDTHIADEAAYEGVLLRHQYRLPLTPITLETMKTRFGRESTIWPRAWIDPRGSAERTIARIHADRKRANVEGMLGLGAQPPEYFRRMITGGRWFQTGEEEVILISTAMARQLGLDPEQGQEPVVQLLGMPFTVVGYFDATLLESLKDLDQNPITPAYLEVSQSEELSEVEIEAIQSGEEVLPKTERFRHASAPATVILPFKKCIDLGGTLKAVALLPEHGQNPLGIAADLSSWLAFPLFVGERGVWYHSAGTTVRYQGVANLIVPILIVIFITLNTMIGHVHERQREIGTYTSVGLAPIHVGFLFIVEALSLAALSTGGYGDLADFFAIGCINGPFSHLLAREGFVGAMISTRKNPGLLSEIAGRQLAEMERYLTSARDKGLRAIALADDIAGKNGLLFSPVYFEQTVLPAYRSVAELAKSHGLYAFLHSDGDMRGVIGLLIDAGFTCLHPVDAQGGIDLRELRKGFPERISFMGHVDLMAWTEERIIDEIAAAEETFCAEGGLILGSAGGISLDVPRKALSVLYPAMREGGQEG